MSTSLPPLDCWLTHYELPQFLAGRKKRTFDDWLGESTLWEQDLAWEQDDVLPAQPPVSSCRVFPGSCQTLPREAALSAMEWAVSFMHSVRCGNHLESAAGRPGPSVDQRVPEDKFSENMRRHSSAFAARGASQSMQRCTESAPQREPGAHRRHQVLPAWSERTDSH